MASLPSNAVPAMTSLGAVVPPAIPHDAPDWIRALPLIDANGGHLLRIFGGEAPPRHLWGAVYSVPDASRVCCVCHEPIESTDKRSLRVETDERAALGGSWGHASCIIEARGKRTGRRKAVSLMAAGSGKEWNRVAP